MRRACRSTSSPHSVSLTPERLFSIRSAPMSDSSRRIWALTAGCVRSKRWAALVKLPSSQMATNVRSRSVGMLVIPAPACPTAVPEVAPLRGRPLRIENFPFCVSRARRNGAWYQSTVIASIMPVSAGSCNFRDMLNEFKLWLQQGTSELLPQFRHRCLGCALEAERRNEAALLVHQVDQRSVVHGVVAVLERHLPVNDPVALC